VTTERDYRQLNVHHSFSYYFTGIKNFTMQDWKAIEIPFRMKDLPRDTNGYPIPFTMLRTEDGAADFTRHDLAAIGKSIFDQLCSICGQALHTDIWLLAGAKIALNPHGGYIDPAMHKQCAVYALKVCPYLALPSFAKRLPNEVDASHSSVRIITGKPVVFALVKTCNYHVVTTPQGGTILLPIRPLLDIEYWREGRCIPWSEAKQLLK
jgi:hypothetical protein